MRRWAIIGLLAAAPVAASFDIPPIRAVDVAAADDEISSKEAFEAAKE